MSNSVIGFLKERPFNERLMIFGVLIALLSISGGLAGLIGLADFEIKEGFEMTGVYIGAGIFATGVVFRIMLMWKGGSKMIALLPVLFLIGCSTMAEVERPEDTTVVRASYTQLSPIVKWVTGGVEVCQLTLLDKTVQENQGQSDTNLALVEDYGVNLTPDGCWVVLRYQLPGSDEFTEVLVPVDEGGNTLIENARSLAPNLPNLLN